MACGVRQNCPCPRSACESPVAARWIVIGVCGTKWPRASDTSMQRVPGVHLRFPVAPVSWHVRDFHFVQPFPVVQAHVRTHQGEQVGRGDGRGGVCRSFHLAREFDFVTARRCPPEPHLLRSAEKEEASSGSAFYALPASLGSRSDSCSSTIPRLPHSIRDHHASNPPAPSTKQHGQSRLTRYQSRR